MATRKGRFGPVALVDSAGNPRPDASVVVRLRGGDPTTVYPARTGGAAVASPLPTGVASGLAGIDAAGNMTVFVDLGAEYEYVATFGGVAQQPVVFAPWDDGGELALTTTQAAALYATRAGGGRDTLNAETVGAAWTLDPTQGNVHDLTLTADLTATLPSGLEAGVALTFTLIVRQDAGGGHTVTWPITVEWDGGSAPLLGSLPGEYDVLALTTLDGGATWTGVGGRPEPVGGVLIGQKVVTGAAEAFAAADWDSVGASVFPVTVPPSGGMLVRITGTAEQTGGVARWRVAAYDDPITTLLDPGEQMYAANGAQTARARSYVGVVEGLPPGDTVNLVWQVKPDGGTTHTVRTDLAPAVMEAWSLP